MLASPVSRVAASASGAPRQPSPSAGTYFRCVLVTVIGPRLGGTSHESDDIMLWRRLHERAHIPACKVRALLSCFCMTIEGVDARAVQRHNATNIAPGHYAAILAPYMTPVVVQDRRRTMTPEERNLVTDLLDRLAALEDTERDPEAERAIKDGLRRAPNAVYALVQTALVQDEALKRADARIHDLEAQLGSEAEQPRSTSFLGNMREALTGRRGSVPTARPGDAPMAAPADYRGPSLPMSAGPGWGRPGGSFLGTAAAASAGMIGGSLMLDSIRSMMGHREGIGGSPGATAPAGGGNLAREARPDDSGAGDDGADQVADDGDYLDDGDFDDGSGDFGDGGSDFGGDGGDT
jgi:uncharacterized protein